MYKKRFLVLISGLFLTQKHKKSHDIAPLIHRANRMFLIIIIIIIIIILIIIVITIIINTCIMDAE